VEKVSTSAKGGNVECVERKKELSVICIKVVVVKGRGRDGSTERSGVAYMTKSSMNLQSSVTEHEVVGLYVLHQTATSNDYNHPKSPLSLMFWVFLYIKTTPICNYSVVFHMSGTDEARNQLNSKCRLIV